MSTKQKGGTGGYKKNNQNAKIKQELKKQQKEKEKEKKEKQQEEKQKQYLCKSERLAEYKRSNPRNNKNKLEEEPILSDKERRTQIRDERKENNEPRSKAPKHI